MTSSNDAYDKVKEGEIEDEYELLSIAPRDPPPPLEELYEVPSTSTPPCQPLPSLLSPAQVEKSFFDGDIPEDR